MGNTLSAASLLAFVAHASDELHVIQRGGRYILADAAGRERLLRGVNLATLGGGGTQVPIDTRLYENGSCPENNPRWYQPPICEADVAGIAARGFDAVRLLVHWAQIEPTPGRYDEAYFRRVSQIIGWAEERNVSVLIDFHQDNYSNRSKACCADDGAPGWAYLANASALSPLERAEVAAMEKLVPQLDWGGAELAFQAFWHNRRVPATGIGVQTHYIQALAQMVNWTTARPGVLGYEIMNEPLPGLDLRLAEFSADYLYPFYARTIQAVTGVRDGLPSCPCEITPGGPTTALRVSCSNGSSPVSRECAYPDLGLRTTKLMAFEPMAIRNQLDISIQRSSPFSTYPNLVYAPHTYTRSFTQWKKEPFWVSLATAEAEALRMRAALMVTEWGGGATANVEAIEAQQEAQRANGLYWCWKQNGGGGWSLHSNTGSGRNFTSAIRMDRLRAVSRVHPRRVAGELLEYRQAKGSFHMNARCDPVAASDGVSEVYFPSHFVGCANSTAVRGAAALKGITHNADGSATAHVVCTGSGVFNVTCVFPRSHDELTHVHDENVYIV